MEYNRKEYQVIVSSEANDRMVDHLLVPCEVN